MRERTNHEPVYRIGVAAKLCGVHPQTLRQYERQGLISPAREGEKNRLYSQADVERVRQIQRLTRDMGVNLAGVEIILKLIDQLEEVRLDMEEQMDAFVKDVEKRISHLLASTSHPVRRDEQLLPVPKIVIRKRIDV
ncbi:MAG: helix-turn-helix transcriptional regulator [Fimbriimonadales bacterium]|nr:helix-turn-helix transcriptional regulator [Fimbriimonadales bacterium]